MWLLGNQNERCATHFKRGNEKVRDRNGSKNYNQQIFIVNDLFRSCIKGTPPYCFKNINFACVSCFLRMKPHLFSCDSFLDNIVRRP